MEAFMNTLAQTLRPKITHWEDWYHVKKRQINQHGGRDLLKKHRNSTAYLILAAFPQYPWQLWRFENVPKGHWENTEQQWKYMEWLKIQLKFHHQEDWYKINAAHFRQNRGRGLLEKYDWSPSKVVTSVYSDNKWQIWRFDNVPKGYWDHKDNQLEYLNWLKEILNFQSDDDWYKINAINFKEHKGSGLLERYDTSPAKVVMSVYSQYSWQPWRFDTVHKVYWDDRAHQLQYMNWLREKT